jgi:S-DNA-T family DNA segregation ATPase FtsK/SpoIIIE
MHYLTKDKEIQEAIYQFTAYPTLWLDTEVDYLSRTKRLSLIQVLFNLEDQTGESAYILDVLDKPKLINEFVELIIINPDIEKVFHNATFDISYLGGKELAQNITCTLKIAKTISLEVLGTSNRKLKTLAKELCNFSDVDEKEQTSDWGQRPLRSKQLNYAKMDVVYLAQVHQTLLKIKSRDTQKKMQNNYFTATDVRIAFECPRLFYLSQHFGGNTVFIPNVLENNIQGIGKTFHKLVREFIGLIKQSQELINLFSTSREDLTAEQITLQMQDIFYRQIFFPNYLQRPNPDVAQSLYSIWQGLQQLTEHWGKLLINYPDDEDTKIPFGKTFLGEELKLEHIFNLKDGTQKLIVGRVDSLIYDWERSRHCAVEFKTYHPIDPSAQLAQISIYSYILQKQLNLPVDAAVYAVLPELKIYHYSWEQLQESVHKLIPAKLEQMEQWLHWKPKQLNIPPATTNIHLCQICPQQEKCQNFFINSSVKQEPDIKKIQTTTLINPNSLGEKLVTTIQDFNIGVDYLNGIVGSSFIRLKLKPHPGVKVDSIIKLSKDLKIHLGIINQPLITPQPGYISVDLPRQDRQIVALENYIKRENNFNINNIKIAIGVDLENKLIEADLSDPNTCHFLVGGTTGSGKSEFLRSLLLSLLYRYSPQQVKIALVDPKRVTFPEFENSSSLFTSIVKDSDSSIALMTELVTEMERRYRLFEMNKCSHLDAYNQKQKSPLERIICIFDEYADFMADKEIANQLEQSIKRLGAMARAAGIHLIVATQRPEAKIVTPIIRSNLPGRIALRTASEADSEIILGAKITTAAHLLGKGDLLYLVANKLERLQSLFTAEIVMS